jgi:hypothetical protein
LAATARSRAVQILVRWNMDFLPHGVGDFLSAAPLHSYPVVKETFQSGLTVARL